MLTRALRCEASPLYWKRSGACAVFRTIGSWAGHVSGSSVGTQVTGAGFGRKTFRGQSGTRRWLKQDQRRWLAGFCYSGNGDTGPYVKEADDDDFNYLKSVQWLSEYAKPEMRDAAEMPHGLAMLGIPLSTRNLQEPMPDPFPTMMQDTWPSGDRPARLQMPLQREGQTPPLLRPANYTAAQGPLLGRMKRKQCTIFNHRLAVPFGDSHVKLRAQVAVDWRAIPFTQADDEPQGLSNMRAYLMPYSRRFDDAFRATAMKARFPQDKLTSWLSTSIADRELWDLQQGLISLESAVQLELASGQGVAALKRMSLQSMAPKKKARSSQAQVLFLATFA